MVRDISGIEIVATQVYCPPKGIRRGLKVRFRTVFPPDIVLVWTPFITGCLSFIHTTLGATTSPSTTFTVHTREYIDPANELPLDDVVTTGGGRAGDQKEEARISDMVSSIPVPCTANEI